MKNALGLLEVSGLALAITCADTMAKAASVTLAGMERTNGSGWTVIKLTGDVASVQASIATGAALARQRQGFIASKVIARPADGIDVFLPARPLASPVAPVPSPTQDSTVADQTIAVQHQDAPPVGMPPAPLPAATEENRAPLPASSPEQASTVTCNLCHDPDCPREKGEPRARCIHHNQ